MMKVKRKYLITTGVLVSIVILLVGLSAIVVLTARKNTPTYFRDNQVKIIDFESSTGPVSPASQQSQSLIVTPNSCIYIVTKPTETPATKTTDCLVSQQDFDAISSSFKGKNIQKLLSEANSDSDILGGPTRSISVTLADGTQLKANVTPDLKQQIIPWLEVVRQYVPQIDSLQL